MSAKVIKLQLPGNFRQYDWLLRKIAKAHHASSMYVDGMKSDPDGPHDETDLSREYGYQESLNLLEYWIKEHCGEYK